MDKKFYSILSIFTILLFNFNALKMNLFDKSASKSLYKVRIATERDIPVIRNLIWESYLALVDIYGEENKMKLTEDAESAMNIDLTIESFSKKYLDSKGSGFWVATERDNVEKVVGTIAIQRKSREEAELVRMSVAKALRGQGIGEILVEVAENFCYQSKARRILLTTANPQAAKFYGKNSFITIKKTQHTISPELILSLYRMCRYLGEVLVRRVVVVGGTHGNERLGIELVKQWTQNPSTLRRDTLSCLPIIGNPHAAIKNCRFLENDLNRMFIGTMEEKEENTNEDLSGEQFLARVLNKEFGPKLAHVDYEIPTGCDFIIDLHSSTSNVGSIAMISAISKDLVAARLSKHLIDRFPDLRVTSSQSSKVDSCDVDSISPSGIAFEVGPLAHGTLDPELLERTRSLVMETINYFDNRNKKLLEEVQGNLEVLSNPEGVIRNYGNPHFDYRSLSVASSALAASSIFSDKDFSDLDYFAVVGNIFYPDDETPAPAHDKEELLMKGLPNDLLTDLYSSSLSSHPRKFCLHPNMIREDWKLLEDGMPLFISTDGSGETIPFQREKYFPGTKITEPLFCIFLNEASYQNSNIAGVLLRKETFSIY